MTVLDRRTNWGGNVAFGAARVHHPRTVEQLQQLVADAETIRPLGTAHSFSRVADTTGDLVSVRGLAPDVIVDDRTATASVPAGLPYAALAVLLHDRGYALPNLGSLPHISVAGACATGTHGSGNGNGCLATSVSAIDFVRGDGEVVSVDDTDPGFAGTVLALGAHGVATRLQLRLEPSFDISQQVWLDAPLARVTASFAEIMAAGYSVSVFSSSRRPEVVDQIWVKTRAGRPAPDGTAWGARPATVELHPLAGQSPELTTSQLGVAGPWHERLPLFRAAGELTGGDEQQSEYLIAAEHGAEALDRVHRLGLGDALKSLEIRSVAADELWLSPCHGRATIGVHFTWHNDDAAVAPAVRRIEDALAGFDPRPHWGKVFALAPDAVRTHYPRLPEVAALAAGHDPERKFGNDFLAAYLY